MPGSFIWRDCATARWLTRVRFFILPSARLHREANRDAITGADFSAVRFVLSDEAEHSRVRLARFGRLQCAPLPLPAVGYALSALRASSGRVLLAVGFVSPKPAICPANARRHSRSCRMAWSRHRA